MCVYNTETAVVTCACVRARERERSSEKEKTIGTTVVGDRVSTRGENVTSERERECVNRCTCESVVAVLEEEPARPLRDRQRVLNVSGNTVSSSTL